MKRSAVLGILVIGGLTMAWLFMPPREFGVERIKDNLFLLTGNGGNTVVFITASGVVLVDTKVGNNGPRILRTVAELTANPVTHIINTHTHADHVGSNEYFPDSVEVVAHENTAARMTRMKEFSAPAAKHGLPDRTFKDRLTLLDGDNAIDLYYFGAAHTDGDAFVVFRALGVMHAGDAYLPSRGSTAVVADGGSDAEYIRTLAKAAAGIKGVNTVIPGHGGVATWQTFVDQIGSIRNK